MKDPSWIGLGKQKKQSSSDHDYFMSIYIFEIHRDAPENNIDEELVRELNVKKMIAVLHHKGCTYSACIRRFAVRNQESGCQHVVATTKCGLMYCTCTSISRLGVPCTHFYAVLVNHCDVPFHITMFNTR